MDEANQQGQEGEPVVDGHSPAVPGASPMPLSMPPFTPSSLDDVRAVGPDDQAPGTALPGAAGGAPPDGGQPPYLPPYGFGWSPGGLPADEAPAHRLTPARHRRTLAALGAVALLTGGLGAGLGVALTGSAPATGGSGSTGPSPTLPSSGGALSSTGSKLSVSQIAGSVEPGVVDIRTTVVQPAGQAAGTGMIITPSGEVLTNNHVVENASSIRVRIAGRSGTFPAKVVGVNPTKDVALLQIQGVRHLPTVRFGNSSSVAVGDPVVAIGNALGLGGTPTVVTGEISATDRTITASDPGLRAETLHHLLQTTAPIQPGDSGGPLVDAGGRVVGMDTANVSNGGSASATIGFAIPIDEARTIVGQMEHHQAVDGTILGSAPFLGIYEASAGTGAGTGVPGGSTFGGLPGFGTSGTPGPSGAGSAAAPHGVSVAGVVSGSPAQQAGIQPGDVITAVGGKATPNWSALRTAIAAKQPGERVTVTFVGGNGTARTVRVTLADFPPK